MFEIWGFLLKWKYIKIHLSFGYSWLKTNIRSRLDHLAFLSLSIPIVSSDYVATITVSTGAVIRDEKWTLCSGSEGRDDIYIYGLGKCNITKWILRLLNLLNFWKGRWKARNKGPWLQLKIVRINLIRLDLSKRNKNRRADSFLNQY